MGHGKLRIARGGLPLPPLAAPALCRLRRRLPAAGSSLALPTYRMLLQVLGAGAASSIGACVVFCVGVASPRVVASSLGFAAGVMLYVSFIVVHVVSQGNQGKPGKPGIRLQRTKEHLQA